jgi:hypothetical protein
LMHVASSFSMKGIWFSKQRYRQSIDERAYTSPIGQGVRGECR